MSLPININTKKKKNIQGHMVAMRLGASKVPNSYVTAISIILVVFYFYFCRLQNESNIVVFLYFFSS